MTLVLPLLFSGGFVDGKSSTEIIRLNIIKYCSRTHWEMKQRQTLTNEQARESIAMDCSCHDHARETLSSNS